MTRRILRSTRRGRPLPTFASLSASPARAGHETPPSDQGGGSPLEPSTNGSPWQATGHMSRSSTRRGLDNKIPLFRRRDNKDAEGPASRGYQPEHRRAAFSLTFRYQFGNYKPESNKGFGFMYFGVAKWDL